MKFILLASLSKLNFSSGDLDLVSESFPFFPLVSSSGRTREITKIINKDGGKKELGTQLQRRMFFSICMRVCVCVCVVGEY